MKKHVLSALALVLFFNVDVKAQQELVSDYFKKVPLEEAHVFGGETSLSSFNPKSIKVLVWNIKKTQEPAWQTEFLSFGRGRELFLLQEVYPNELFKNTLGVLSKFRWDMGISFRYVLMNDLPTGTMIGSKVEPIEVIIKHTPDLEPMTETPKAMTLARYPLTDRKDDFLVINIHGINFTDFYSFQRQINQAKEEIENHEGPVLIAGDFNTRNRERTEYMYKVMKALKMEEVSFKNANQRMVAKFSTYYLDYAFVRGLKVTNAEVLGGAKGSDHKPMTLDLSL
ncbi:endonuclease/exonuclease/phosphatase family protein [Peredibacter starrii]|uniref:Endonuclease/exonuclease/phosphatase family protein n=1 Tax=Peredibacter starrii TaxID=28202 RepID=A0AAX4HUH7_9BACT|nr:endonuclease/exonuclease/phosphatase family protein [Peredibacter starrii]WPU66738.1 endonuclease/exonuclease/phosphatase family protein [Peredibacter starrii]